MSTVTESSSDWKTLAALHGGAPDLGGAEPQVCRGGGTLAGVRGSGAVSPWAEGATEIASTTPNTRTTSRLTASSDT